MTARIYLAGPMTGYRDFNFPAFHRAEALLLALGLEVENPANTEHPAGTQWDGYMRSAIRQMLTCQGVATLNGWETSRGARLELEVATQIGMVCAPLGAWISQAVSVEGWNA